jgi:hypothetical protein
VRGPRWSSKSKPCCLLVGASASSRQTGTTVRKSQKIECETSDPSTLRGSRRWGCLEARGFRSLQRCELMLHLPFFGQCTSQKGKTRNSRPNISQVSKGWICDSKWRALSCCQNVRRNKKMSRLRCRKGRIDESVPNLLLPLDPFLSVFFCLLYKVLLHYRCAETGGFVSPEGSVKSAGGRPTWGGIVG